MNEKTEKQARYSRNVQAFSWEELAVMQTRKVAIVGLGGLGGYVCQSLGRFGVGQLTLIDGDVFAQSNLNRQVFASESTLGKNKALVSQKAMEDINPTIKVEAYPLMLTEENAEAILTGHDIVVDCLDNIPTRFVVANVCGKLKIPMVHGAIGGFFGQVANLFPGDEMLEKIYPSGKNTTGGLEKTLGNPAFTPQFVAALQCSEVLKLLAGNRPVLRNEMLHIDLLNNSFEIISFV